MKSAVFWVGLCVVLYGLTGLAFPYSLYREFGWEGFGTVLAGGAAKGFAGLSDYMRLYPHMVIYPSCWSLIAFLNLGLALSALWTYAAGTGRMILWRTLLVASLAILAVFSGTVSLIEAQNPGMMLFEFAPGTQAKPHGEFIGVEQPPADGTTLAGLVFETVKRDAVQQQPPPVMAQTFDWKKTWKQRPALLSKSRPFYIASFACLIWAALAIVLCSIFAATMPKGLARNRTVLATVGAALGLCLWFPHRVYYNVLIKAKLYGELENPFQLFPLPASLKARGLGSTESLLMLLLAVLLFVVVVVIFKKDPKALVDKFLKSLAVVGISGTSIWGILDPKMFGNALGIMDGHWAKLVVCTALLFFLLLLQVVFTVLQQDAGPPAAGAAAPHPP